MIWKIELLADAERALEKLDKQVARRIYAFLSLRLAKLENPRLIGEALKGSRLGEFWKYRVGDYRIVARIEDNILRVLVVKAGHRREVYER
jgi:mRNA interferase RelE/StbE